jgi:hypothetical protein
MRILFLERTEISKFVIQTTHMKQLAILTFILLLGATHATYAQDDAYESAQKADHPSTKLKRHADMSAGACRKAYIGFSMGFNNPGGILGFDIDIPIVKSVSIGGGFGSSTWGNKIYLDARYYLHPCQRGLAFGAGITHNTGSSTYKTNTDTYGGREKVTLKLDPQTNMFIGAYYFWTLGKKYNRFYAQLGYSVPFTSCSYTELAGDPLTEKGDRRIRNISPGGMMAGFGFSFGVH